MDLGCYFGEMLGWRGGSLCDRFRRLIHLLENQLALVAKMYALD